MDLLMKNQIVELLIPDNTDNESRELCDHDIEKDKTKLDVIMNRSSLFHEQLGDKTNKVNRSKTYFETNYLAKVTNGCFTC